MVEKINPIDAFPIDVQEIITHYSTLKGYSGEWFMTGVLAACSVSLGSFSKLDIQNGYVANAIIWAIIVGDAGSTKSPALDDAFMHLDRYQYNLNEQYKAEFDAATEDARKKMGDPATIIISNTTPEALQKTLVQNRRGCIIKVDEIAGWVKDFDKYSKGGDEQMYLSLWNGAGISKHRVGTTGKKELPLSSPSSFLSVIGGTQPEIMHRYFGTMTESGFFDRFLICHPENQLKPYPSKTRNTVNPIISGRYRQLLDTLMQSVGRQATADEPYMVYYTHDAYDIIHKYQCEMVDRHRASNDPREKSIVAKMDIYVHRFALLLHWIYWASDPKRDSINIGEDVANAAVLLTTFYLREASKTRIDPPAEKLEGTWKALYDALPEPGQFMSRAMIVERASVFKISQRTTDRWLKANSGDGSEHNKLLLKGANNNYGKYSKRL